MQSLTVPQMLTARKVGTVLVSLYVGMFLANFVLDEILGLEGAWVLAVILCTGVLAGLFGVAEARGLRPLTVAEQRDSILGWGVVVSLMVLLGCFLLPEPWSLISAAVVLVLASGGLWRVSKLGPPDPRRTGDTDRS